MEEFERLRAAAVTVKQRIVRANLRLVVAIARNTAVAPTSSPSWSASATSR